MFGKPEHLKFLQDVPKWLREGKFIYKEDIREGLEAAPSALLDVLAGRNHGKTVVRVVKDQKFDKYTLYK
jgi:NADPH-dependent curcumin reductase CurA